MMPKQHDEAGDVTPVGIIDAAEALVTLYQDPKQATRPPAEQSSNTHPFSSGPASSSSALGSASATATAATTPMMHVLPSLNPYLPAPFPRRQQHSVTPAQVEQRLVPPPPPASAHPALALYHASAARLCQAAAAALPPSVPPIGEQHSALHAHGWPPAPRTAQSGGVAVAPPASGFDSANYLLQQWHASGHVTAVHQAKRAKMR